MYDDDTFEIEQAPGTTFRVKFPHDDSHGAPWEEEDGHGPVRRVVSHYSRPDKRPGEVAIHSNRFDHWLYDVAEATRIAKRDGWGLCPDEKAKLAERLGRQPTPGDIAAESVRRDMEYLRRWLNDDWWYVGVVVELLDDDGDVVDERSIWGIESDSGDYLEETARDLAFELASDHELTTEDIERRRQEAIAEADERQRWAERDVITA